jgi:1,4-dihydroxy-2-naphthoyl-CoA synthase
MGDTILLRQDHGAVARLTMNAPDRLNALSDAMLAALAAEFDRLSGDRKVRVVVLAGRARPSARATTCARCRRAGRRLTGGLPISPISSGAVRP